MIILLTTFGAPPLASNDSHRECTRDQLRSRSADCRTEKGYNNLYVYYYIVRGSRVVPSHSDTMAQCAIMRALYRLAVMFLLNYHRYYYYWDNSE